MDARVNRAVGIVAGVGGLLGATGALAASSCCALPLALSLAGVGGTWLGGLAALAPFRPYVLAAAAAAIVAGWVVTLRRRRAACDADGGCAPGRAGFVVLGVATLLLGAAAGWGWVEPTATAALMRLAAGTA